MLLFTLLVSAPLAVLAPAPAPAVTNDMTVALDAIEVDDVRADLYFLASDELGGRDTPSSGQRIAARYIASRLERLGWRPGAPGGFLYRYWLGYQAVDPAQCTIVLERGAETFELVFGSDYFFHASNADDEAWEGEVVFCGSGTKEEFDAAEVEGKWAFTWHSDLSWRKRQVNAKAAGALGLLVAPGPDYDGEPYLQRYGSWATAQMQPRWPSRFEREVFPSSYVTAEAAARLFPELADSASGSPEAPAVGTLLAGRLRDTRAKYGIGGEIELENVVAIWPGSDPELASEVILLSAHYDHVGINEQGEIHNGADDNASGSTGLLAVASALAENGPLRRSVVLMWVSAEEKGLLGSRAWSTYPWLPEGYRPICNINIDMIGRNASDYLLITPTAAHEAYSELTQIAQRLAPLEGFPELGSADAYYHRSDQAMFEEHLGLPVAFLFSDVHEDYHQPSDTADKIDMDKILRVARLVVRVLGELQSDELKIAPAPSDVWHQARARGDLRALSKSAELWSRAHDGRAPQRLEDLLAPSPDGAPAVFERDAIPLDPWGREYNVVRPSDWFDGYELRSFGRDGKPGGEGEDADLTSVEF